MATKKTTSATGTTRPKIAAKPKATPKPRAASGAGYTAKQPTPEEIRKKAGELYLERLASGEDGTAEQDWLRAEELLTGKKR